MMRVPDRGRCPQRLSYAMHFSVIVPLYNKAPYVAVALRSLLQQTETDLEVVVVDDGSRDDSVAVVQGLGDPRIRIVSQANAGVSAARNRGIAEARGDWVAFLDADDWVHPEFLARMRTLAAAHPGLDMVAGGFRTEPDGPGWQPSAVPLDDTAPVEIIDNLPRRWARPSFCTGSVAFRREFLLSLMPCFPVGERQGEDLDLWFRAAERTAIAYLPLPFLCYRTEVAQSAMAGPKHLDFLPFQQRLRERALRGQMPRRLVGDSLRLVGDWHVTMARRALAVGRRGAAIGALARGWRAMGHHRWWFTLLMLAGLVKPR